MACIVFKVKRHFGSTEEPTHGKMDSEYQSHLIGERVALAYN
jgi:hypothetical protein